MVPEKILESPLDSREIKPVNSKEINPEYSLEGLKPKQKPQYFGHLMRGGDLLKKTLVLGKTEGKRRRGQQRMRWLDSITNLNGHELERTPGGSEGQRGLACCSQWDRKELDTT